LVQCSATDGQQHQIGRCHPCFGKWFKSKELEEAWEYYHTPRAQYPTAPGFATARSLSQIITYDAFNMAEVFLTQAFADRGRECGGK
jgi:hypothetical protein